MARAINSAESTNSIEGFVISQHYPELNHKRNFLHSHENKKLFSLSSFLEKSAKSESTYLINVGTITTKVLDKRFKGNPSWNALKEKIAMK